MASLTSEEAASCERHMIQYLVTHPSITNRELRALTGVSYDQAISFFNIMVVTGRLVRVGKASGTRYELPRESNE